LKKKSREEVLEKGKDIKEKMGSGYSLEQIKIQEMLKKPKPKFKSLGMGVHNDTFYFGSKIYDENGSSFDAIITSDKKIYVNWHFGWKSTGINQIRNHFGLNYRWEFFDSILDGTWITKV